MTRPAPITAADLNRYPHLGYTIPAPERQDSNKPAPAPVPAAERASITITVPRIGMPRVMDPDRLENGVYGFVVGVIFMGILGILGRMM